MGQRLDAVRPWTASTSAATTGTPRRSYPNAPSEFTAALGSAVTQDRATGDIYVFGNFAVARWSSASNTWTRLLSNTGTYGQYAASAKDTKRNRILVVGGENNDRGLYDMASNTMSSVTFTGPNASAMRAMPTATA